MKKFIFTLIAAAVGLTACVEDPIYNMASVSNLKNTVAYNEDDAVTVTAEVTALVPVLEANLIYKAGSAAEKREKMTASGKTWTGQIPAQPLGTEVKYSVEAVTDGGTVRSTEVSYKVGDVPINYSGLVLNELNGNNKFIELFNKGTEDIRIKGVTIQKDEKLVWTAGSVILKPGAYLLLYSVDVKADHPDHDPDCFFDSGLSAKKAVKVELFDPKGASLDKFNLVNFKMTAPASYSRVPNGTGGWFFTDATPAAVNASDNSTPVQGLE